MIHSKTSKRAARRGAAFLVLVVLVLLVVVGATQTLVRSELTVRRGESGRIRARSMLAAIEAIRQDGTVLIEPLQLPMDGSTGEYIEVSMNDPESDVTETDVIARWVKGDQVIDEMRQKIKIKVEPSE